MCFTPAIVIFAPFAPIFGVWAGSLYYPRQWCTSGLERQGVFVAGAATSFHALGWALAVGGGAASYALQQKAVAALATARRTSAALLSDHALDAKEVWAAVKPAQFQQPDAAARLGAVRSTVIDLVKLHAPAVFKITCRGAASCGVVGLAQPLATCVAAAAGTGAWPTAPPSPRRTLSGRQPGTGASAEDLQARFQRVLEQ
jgi:hypothetical protein